MPETIIVSRGLGGSWASRITGIGSTQAADLNDRGAIPEVPGNIAGRALTAHTHIIADIAGLREILENKAALVHGHSATVITYAPPGIIVTANNIQAALNQIEVAISTSLTQVATEQLFGLVKIGSGISVNSGVISVSTNYAAPVHTHTAAQITDFVSAVIAAAPPTIDASLLTTGTLSDSRLSANVVFITDSRLSDARTPLSHTHTASQITDFVSAVIAAAPTITNASLLTTGTLADSRLSANVVFTTDARLSDARTPTAHTHTASQITDFTSAVIAAAPPTTNASLLTTGTLSDSRLSANVVFTTDARLSDARTPTAHTHTAAQITDFVSAVIAAAPPTTDASLLTTGTLSDSRLSSNIARTSDVSAAVSALVNSAPSSLDTLKELADALGSDANFATTVTNALATKAPINNPTFTGTVGGVTKSVVGLGNVDNTSDLNKPISSATQSALDNKANLTHVHGNITNDGKIGTASGQIIVTTTGGVLTTATSISWAQINTTPTTLSGYGITDAVLNTDSRLSDARTPTAHTHTASQITDFTTAVIAAAPPTTNASLLTTGTLSDSRLSANVVFTTDARLSDARTPIAHTHSASDITSGTINTARLGSGTASSSTFLRGDGAWISIERIRRFDGSGNTSYIGTAPIGSAESDAVWKIKRTIINTDGGVLSSLTANNVSWTSRITATYS
jgi:hypothetical protein